MRQPNDPCAAPPVWLHLDDEANELNQHIAEFVAHDAPALLDVFGVGPEVAASLLITAGGNPDRMRNEGSFAAPMRHQPHPSILRQDPPAPAQPRR